MIDRATLISRITESLVVYHDPDPARRFKNGVEVGYLRFVPLETDAFRHGVTVYVGVARGDEESAKAAVAEYLADAITLLMEQTP